ncbi:MAG: aminotransferase class I/II-fold pyridoxal phosphate-dependent enzyme, partial [Hyphomicrobiaceae bacterium]
MASLDTVQSPFDRLRVLIGDTPPGDDPIDLTVGEPRHEMPDFLVAKLTEVADQFARYPLIGGSDGVREAICRWHERRYGISLDPGRNVIISSGSRDGLVTAVLPAIKGRADEG